MKIRIKGNTLRLRLSQTDVRNLGEQGWVEEQTPFEQNIFKYRLERSNGDAGLHAGFVNNVITVFIKDGYVDEMVQTDCVGFSAVQPAGNGNTLSILVEKDFQCIDQTAEDQSDMYQNPNKTC